MVAGAVNSRSNNGGLAVNHSVAFIVFSTLLSTFHTVHNMAQKHAEQQEAEMALLGDEHEDDSTSEDDLEANLKPELESASTEPEYQTPMTLKFLWLSWYFGASMALTIYNKFILGSVSLSTWCVLIY